MASIFVFFLKGVNISAQQRKRNLALITTLWVSILAPLSWYVIFKGHSYIHTHMNHILWQMPFTFFGFAVCGVAIKSLFDKVTVYSSR